MKNIKYITVFFSLLAFFSCTDILDTEPENALNENTMWKTEELADKGVDGIYQALRRPLKSKTGSDSDSNPLVGANDELGHYAWEAFGMTGQTRLSAGNVFSSSVNASNPNFSYTWKWCYTGGNRATDAILKLPNTAMNAAKRERYLAEAKTLRAFFYMRLNELFGRGIGIPIYDFVQTPTNFKKTQNTEAEVWDFIIKDLTEAINSADFPNQTIGTASSSGRVSKGTAYALRGRAYLMKSMSLKEDHYQLAADDFEKVGQMGYSLFSNYAGLFTTANETCGEILLSVENTDQASKEYSSTIQKYVAPWNAGAANRGSCWTDLQVTPAVVDLYEVIKNDGTCKPFNWEDYIPGYNSMKYEERQVYFIRDTRKNGAELDANITSAVNIVLNKIPLYKSTYLAEGNEARIIKAYQNRDPRLAASVITPYSDFVGINNNTPTGPSTYTSRWPVSGKYFTDMAQSESSLIPGMNTTLVANGNQYFYYMFRKFIGTGMEYQNRDFNPIDEPIMRYADVLLMWAEALVELGDLQGAKEKVEQVRNRVGMPTMSSYFADQTTARNYVRDERRREFVCEGVNFFDEMRWKTLKETKFTYGPSTSMQVWGGVATGAPSYNWTEAWYTWPVPKEEVERNTSLKRTPGWIY